MRSSEVSWESIIAEVDKIIFRNTGNHLNVPQIEALRSALESRTGTIQMPTGCGKTRLVSALILALGISGFLRDGDKVLFLTPRRVLRRQTVRDEFELTLRNIEEFVHLRVKEIESHGFERIPVMPWERRGFSQPAREALLESLESGRDVLVCVLTPQTWMEYFKHHGLTEVDKVRVLIGDEGHYFYSGAKAIDSIQKLINTVMRNEGYVIGMTATPTRETVDIFGPIKYMLSSLEAMRMGILTSRLKIYPYITSTTLDDADLRDEWQVAVRQRAEEYASLIVERLRGEAEENNFSLEDRVPKTLVVAANIKEARLLADSLKSRLKSYGKRDKVYEAHMGLEADNAEAEAHEVLEMFRKDREGVIVTVDMAKMGFDDRNLEVLAIARKVGSPTAYIQVRGRVLRRPDSDFSIKNPRNGRGGYAVIIALHYERDFERELERIERWENLENNERVGEYLSGFGQGVKVVDGQVSVKDLPMIMVDAQLLKRRTPASEQKSSETSRRKHSKPISTIRSQYCRHLLLREYIKEHESECRRRMRWE